MPKENTARDSIERANRKHLMKTTAVGNRTENFDSLIHERTRLAIVSTLAVNKSLSFPELKSILDLTDGNLSVHAQKLEEAGYVHCKKSFEGRKPKTVFRLSAKGRAALDKYLSHMERLIHAVRTD